MRKIILPEINTNNLYFGPGHLICPLIFANDVRAKIFEKGDATEIKSYLYLTPEPFPIFLRDRINLLRWLLILGKRSDVNLAAYGDGGLLEAVQTAWEQLSDEAKSFKDTYNHSEFVSDYQICETALQPFCCEESSQLQNSDVLVLDVANEYEPDKKLPTIFEEANQINFLYIPQLFNTKAHLVSYTVSPNKNTPDFFSPRFKLQNIEFPCVHYVPSLKRPNAIRLEEADIIIISSPRMFERDLFGVLILAALSSDAPIHIFNDNSSFYEMLVNTFAETLTSDDLQFATLKKRLLEIVWERMSDTYSPDINKKIREAKKPAVICEGAGTLETASKAEYRFLLQPSPTDQKHLVIPRNSQDPCMCSKFKDLFVDGGDCFYRGDKIILAYINAFRNLTKIILNVDLGTHLKYQTEDILSLKTSILALLKIHEKYANALQAVDNKFFGQFDITEKPLAAYYYELMRGRLNSENLNPQHMCTHNQ